MKNNFLLEYKWRNYILQEAGVPLPRSVTRTAANVAKEAPEAAKTSIDVAPEVDYNRIGSRVSEILTANGVAKITIESIKAKILKGLPGTIESIKREKGISFINGTKFTVDFIGMIQELIAIAQKLKIPIGAFLEGLFVVSRAGAFVAEAATGVGLLLTAKDLGDWLAKVGKDFKKSTQSFATRDIIAIDERIKSEGFAKVKQDLANTSIKQMQIFSKLSDATTLNPRIPIFYPKVVDLLDDYLAKTFRPGGERYKEWTN